MPLTLTGARRRLSPVKRSLAPRVRSARQRVGEAIGGPPRAHYGTRPSKAEAKPAAQPGYTTRPPDSYLAMCAVCGRFSRFVRDGLSVRETFPCTECGASHRYRHQAEVMLAHLSRQGSANLDELAAEQEFAAKAIFEPGWLGPFRPRFSPLPGYVTSGFWPDVEPGETRDGVRCENLEALTFDDETFDLIITSDIFEHVRHPERGFAETFRVLRPGGLHIFSVPVRWPLAHTTRPRVDVSGPEDVLLLDAEYHYGSLVYNDFGYDLVDQLEAAGFHALLPRAINDTVTVVARRPDA
ncbi:MAG: methyltransferase domain-containing protein [Acidimicrobiales bacterium]|nr:methyltransferase domain-containing protein [Acidimicrobiales bacterium]